MPYRDLREYLAALERAGKLHHVTAEVDKDWEISAVARQVFRTFGDDERPALMFDRVKGHDIPVVLGVLGGSPSIYAMAVGVDGPRQIPAKWAAAQKNPIPPRRVETGPVKERILKGDAIDMRRFPVPTWTVGEDPAPYLTAPFVITRDPETGEQNMGTYRVMVKEPRKVVCWINFVQHGRRHVEKHEERGIPTPVAIVLGADPTVGLTSVARIVYGTDELAVAGALRGEPIEVVRCETSDLWVPATAEIVIEGTIRPGALEPEGPFGEYTGYMGPKAMSYPIEIECITHRERPIYQAFLSQMPPSESSCIRSVGRENAIYKHLAEDLRLPVTGVHLLHAGGASAYLAISIRKEYEGQPKQVMLAALSVDPTLGKYTVVVDDDIDVYDPFMVNWALSFRTQPERDIEVIREMPAVRLDPSQAAEDVPQLDRSRRLSSKCLIDATKKHRFPPIALPPREHLERVRADWKKYGF